MVANNAKNLELNAVKMEKESNKTDSAVSVENNKKPRAICSFIKVGNIGRTNDLEVNKADEDKEIENDAATIIEENVGETFAKALKVAKKLSHDATDHPEEFENNILVFGDNHFQSHKLIVANLSMIKTEPPDLKSSSFSQRKLFDMARQNDQNLLKIKTSRNVLISDDPDEEQNMFQVNHDEENDVFQQVDNLENDVFPQVDAKEVNVFRQVMMKKVRTNIQLKKLKQIPKIKLKKNFPGQVLEG